MLEKVINMCLAYLGEMYMWEFRTSWRLRSFVLGSRLNVGTPNGKSSYLKPGVQDLQG